jgi:hypothetical protein
MTLEWLMLADGAQVLNNKLYVLGGGWEVMIAPSGFPYEKVLTMAAAFRVPWNETNQKHEIEVEVADADGQSLAKLNGQVEVGRPAGLDPGSEQRIQIPLEAPVRFEKPGRYVTITRVGGEDVSAVPFSVTGPLRSR